MGIGRKTILSSYMLYTSTSLKIVGLWPTGSSGVINLSYFIFVAVGLIVQVFQMLTNCWINYTNFESAAETIGPMMALITSFGKMCIYRHERSRLWRLIVSLENCLKNGPIDVLENLEDYAKVGSLACGSLIGVSWLLTVAYLSAPLAYNENILPFASYYPFDYKNSTFLYVLAYGHEVMLTCLGCCTMSTEITFVWSICHCCSRLRVLRQRFSELLSSETKNKDEETLTNKIDLQLSSLAKLHSEVLRDLEEINLAYTYIVMVLFFAALIAICCAGLQITGGPSGTINWTVCLFLVLALYYAEQLLFYYLPGEILAQEAMDVSFAVYACGWEIFNSKHRKIVGLMIMRSQLPPRLLVGQLIPLRLENYSAFLTTTASYFASIRAVAEE